MLERILRCPNLPTLPTVAVRVIDLTQNVNVSMDDLTETIQNDQGLAAKILKTVNSSFYGLAHTVSSVEHAVVVLGLEGVKTIVLGFSLLFGVGAYMAAKLRQAVAEHEHIRGAAGVFA